MKIQIDPHTLDRAKERGTNEQKIWFSGSEAYGQNSEKDN